jgi:hypothetical protein
MAEFEITRAEWESLHERFRMLKHDMGNHLGLMTAMAELFQRKPDYAEKLAAAVLERVPLMVEQMQLFQQELAGKLERGGPAE